jgi:hypothetical protein
MTTLLVEAVGRPRTARDERALDSVRDRASDELAGRTIWSATGLPGGAAGAQALRECLGWASESGVTARPLAVGGVAPLRELATRLEAMLQGAGADARLGPAEERTYSDGVRDSDALLGDEVGAGDVVVLHDALATALAQDVRERGAHAVWSVRTSDAPWDAGVSEAWTFLRRRTPAVDAIVVTWFEHGDRGMLVEQVAAIMPSADLIAAKQIAPAPPARATPPYEDVAWSSALADVVHSDRGERVGGMRHPRPAVPVR